MKDLVNMAFDLQNIIRYNTFYKLKNESVAEHSFVVLASVKQLCKEYNVPDDIKLRAYDAAILHDIPESVINDITYDAKQLFSKEFNEELNKIEQDILSEIDVHASDDLFKNNFMAFPTRDLVRAIVEYGDVQSVVLYLKREIKLGNKSSESEEKNVEERFKKVKENFEEKLEDYNNAKKR